MRPQIIASAMLIALITPLSATARTVGPDDDFVRAGTGDGSHLYGAAYFDPLQDFFRPIHFLPAPGEGWMLDPLAPPAYRRPDAGAGGIIIGPSGYYKIVLERAGGSSDATTASAGGRSAPPPPVASRRSGGRPGSGGAPSIGGSSSGGLGSTATPSSSSGVFPPPEDISLLGDDGTGDRDGSGVTATQTPAVPLPPAGALILSALVGLGLRRRA